jgi:hypothetical protein
MEEAEKQWQQRADEAKASKPLKELKQLPKVVAMSEDTRRFFRVKSLAYLLWHDQKARLLRQLLKNPLKNARRYLSSILKGKSYQRLDDFFFYGLKSEEAFKKLYASQPSVPFLLGFSYCHKPFECPDDRFSDKCRADLENTVCQQCFIAKMVHFSPKRAQLLFIPTVHYIAQKVFEAKQHSPNGQVFFLITACEMTLEMFGDWGNAVGIEGIGVRLDGRICNTMKAFVLSEKGIKPGLTVVTNPTQERMLSLIKALN